MVGDWNWQHVREVLVKSNDNDNIENEMAMKTTAIGSITYIFTTDTGIRYGADRR